MTHSTSTGTLTREVYDAFQRAELDRWDHVIDRDVLVNSPAGFGLRGLDGLKDFARQFTTLGYRIDLLDEHEALDETGSGRAFTFNLHWKHAQPFGGLAPTGREGTSIETLLLTVANGQVTRIDVLDGSLDLAAYEWDRGWPVPHNVSPDPIAARERLTGELHDAYARREFDRWDAIVAEDVVIDSLGGRGAVGRVEFRQLARAFAPLWYRNDLVDEHLALDDEGTGRGLISYVLHWKHESETFGLAPTGREGTLVETMLLTVERGLITRISIAVNTLDLPLYLWSRGVPFAHNLSPAPLVAGVDRRNTA